MKLAALKQCVTVTLTATLLSLPSILLLCNLFGF